MAKKTAALQKVGAPTDLAKIDPVKILGLQDDEIAALQRVEEIAAAVHPLVLSRFNTVTQELLLARASQQMYQAIDGEVFESMKWLKNNEMGFKTDEGDRNGSAVEYDDKTVKLAMLQAKLRGLSWMGNQFNILFKGCYVTAEGYENSLLPNLPGLEEWDIDCKDFVRVQGGGIMTVDADWTYNSKKYSFRGKKISVALQGNQGFSAAVTKCRRAACREILRSCLSKSGVGHLTPKDGDVTDGVTITVEAPAAVIIPDAVPGDVEKHQHEDPQQRSEPIATDGVGMEGTADAGKAPAGKGKVTKKSTKKSSKKAPKADEKTEPPKPSKTKAQLEQEARDLVERRRKERAEEAAKKKAEQEEKEAALLAAAEAEGDIIDPDTGEVLNAEEIPTEVEQAAPRTPQEAAEEDGGAEEEAQEAPQGGHSERWHALYEILHALQENRNNLEQLRAWCAQIWEFFSEEERQAWAQKNMVASVETFHERIGDGANGWPNALLFKAIRYAGELLEKWGD